MLWHACRLGYTLERVIWWGYGFAREGGGLAMQADAEIVVSGYDVRVFRVPRAGVPADFAAPGASAAVVAPGAPLVVLNTFGDEGEAVAEALAALVGAAEPAATAAQDGRGVPSCTLVTVDIPDWNRDMSPWPADALSARDEPFVGGADTYLDLLVSEILPAVRASLDAPPAWTGIAGYSLAGLFAAYAMYRTDAFARVASASGSLWYPGFPEFARSTAPARMPERLYLSLGDKEAKTRHPLMRNVQDATEAFAEHFRNLGVPTTFELNPGNHFADPPGRTARAIAGLLK